jgi:hypothetical protein
MQALEVHHEPLDNLDALTRASVAASTDVEQLYGWLGHQQRLADELEAMCYGIGLAGGDGHGIGRKLGYVKISVTWIVRRLSELGEDETELRKVRVQAKQITLLHAKIAELKLQVAEGRL